MDELGIVLGHHSPLRGAKAGLHYRFPLDRADIRLP